MSISASMKSYVKSFIFILKKTGFGVIRSDDVDDDIVLYDDDECIEKKPKKSSTKKVDYKKSIVDNF